MGNERAVLAARGVRLSPRGSARDTALREIVKRERRERFAAIQLFANIIGAGLGISEKNLDSMLDLYLLELSQDRYRPSIVAAMREARVARQNQRLADRQLLQKVDSLSDPDEPTPKRQVPRKGARRR